MRIAELEAYLIRLPLRKEFKHASQARQASENLVVRCRLDDGTLGWGEGVPRCYVTGETPAGCLDQLAATPLSEQLAEDCGGWQDVFRLCAQFQPVCEVADPRDCRSNALRCAVELSILDAFTRLFQQPLSAVSDHFEPARSVRTKLDRVQYSTAIDAKGSRRQEFISALKMRIYGFRHCKVKVGAAQDDDDARLLWIRRGLGPQMDIRLDANEAWSPTEVLQRVRPLLRHRVSCIEQPVAHAQVGSLADIRRELSVPVMLDESLTSLVDAQRAIQMQTCDLFNLRLSKCGGYLNCLRLAAAAQAAGLGYQLGCHPGESGILSAAGRHFATSVRGIRYREGSYDRHLLGILLTRPDMTFGYGGRAPALRTAGLGISVEPELLQQVTYQQATYRLG